MSAIRSRLRYLAFVRQSLREELVYRDRLFFWLINLCIRIAAQLFFWAVVFQQKQAFNGFTMHTMFSYVFLTSALSFVFSLSFLLDRKLVESIVDGSISMNLVRPSDLYVESLCGFIGKVSFRLVCLVPLLVVAIIWFGPLKGPQGLFMWLLFVLSLVLGLFLWHSVRWLFSLLVFWTENADSLNRLCSYIVQFLSGSLLPLSFFPGSFQKVFFYLPFQSVVYTPTAIFTNAIGSDQARSLVLLEFFWVVVLFGMSRYCWSKAVRVLTVAGG